jgi:hypothetical protein
MRVCLCAALLLAVPGFAKSKDFNPLFNGKTLAGWEALPGGDWQVEDGVIVGKGPKSEKRHGQLVSTKTYGNFILKLQFQALQGNSGVYFRVEKIDHAVAVKGFQAEVDAAGSSIGGLYETLGRAWVVQPKPALTASHYRMKEWNEMVVAAVGGDITVQVNGVETARLRDDPGLRSGHIALQLHGNQDMHVRYKDIRIRELPSDKQPVVLHEIHDRSRPLPPAAAPKPGAELDSKAPAGATVLFDGSNMDAWKSQWKLVDGSMQTAGKGDCTSTASFGDCRLHLEWRVTDPKRSGNSGVFLMSLFEVQVFNSHNNRTKIYADGQAAAIYGQYPPSANACREPGEWEYYDIDFTAPRFDANKQLVSPAVISVTHNGVLVQDKVVVTGPTSHYRRPFYPAGVETGPVRLQHHGDTLQYRNIWLLEK